MMVKMVKGVDIVAEGLQQVIRKLCVEEIPMKEGAFPRLASIGGQQKGIVDPWVCLDDGDAVVLREESTPPTQVRFEVVGDGAVA